MHDRAGIAAVECVSISATSVTVSAWRFISAARRRCAPQRLRCLREKEFLVCRRYSRNCTVRQRVESRATIERVNVQRVNTEFRVRCT